MEKYIPVSFRNIQILEGFWKIRQDTNRNVTAQAVYDRFSDTHRFAALNCLWKEGQENQPHFFWDSDIAKWLEGAAYLLAQSPDPHLEALCDHAIAAIVKNQDADGYFNSHFLVTRQDERFQHRSDHELYCAGHLMEAACAYYEATGKDAFLNAMCRFADYIYDRFLIFQDTAFVTCGHPEIELALVRLADTAQSQKYLDLARFFLEKRGNNDKDITPYPAWFTIPYAQDHMPLKQQTTAEGHAVRALYTYCAMADMAGKDTDTEYFAACQAILDNILNKRMYITGGVGSSYRGEAFTIDYDLPNKTAYAETCAAIALALFCRRMQALDLDSKYADTIERVIYNGAISGVSLDGKAFFYENPLESDPYFQNRSTASVDKSHAPILQRLEVFGCSCCPPNILRFVASIADSFYTYDNDTLFVHQFAQSVADIAGATVTQKTNYPADGQIHLELSGGSFRKLAIRIPGWCRQYALSVPYHLHNGYAIVDIPQDGIVDVSFAMPVEKIESNLQVQENAGRVAVQRGPVVYCLESTDNGSLLRSLHIGYDAQFTLGSESFCQVPVLHTTGYRKQGGQSLYRFADNTYTPVPLTFIPYYAYANRGPAEMTVWVAVQ